MNPIVAHCCEVMYFGCYDFRGELGFLNCDDICMCVVNKQFELLEFVFESVYVDVQYDAPNGYNPHMVGVPQSRGTVQFVSIYPEAQAPSFFLEASHASPQSKTNTKTLLNTLTQSSTLTKFTNSPVQPSQSSPPSLSPAHSPPNPPTFSNPLCPLCKPHPHTTVHLFYYIHLYTLYSSVGACREQTCVFPL